MGEGGGVFTPYTCSDIDYWLVNEAEKNGVDSNTAAFLVDNWYKPKCCESDASSSNSGVEEQKEVDMEDEGENEENIKGNLESDAIISAASNVIGSGTFLAVLSAIVAMAL